MENFNESGKDEDLEDDGTSRTTLRLWIRLMDPGDLDPQIIANFSGPTLQDQLTSSGFIYGFTEEYFQVRVVLQTYFGGFLGEDFQVRVDFRT